MDREPILSVAHIQAAALAVAMGLMIVTTGGLPEGQYQPLLPWGG